MRKLRLLSFSLLAIIFITVSCTKEGPEGPVGAQGPQGPAGSTGANGAAGTNGTNGTQGPPGTANVIYSTWYTTVAADWSVGGVAPYWDNFKYTRTTPGVTQAIIDNGVVLAYMKDWVFDPTGAGTSPQHSATTVQLPFLADINFMDYWDFAIPAVGSIRFMYKSQAQWGIGAMPGVSYRYVIIPGGVAGGRLASGTTITYNGYTKDQLKAMSYRQVAELFKIPETGSNE